MRKKKILDAECTALPSRRFNNSDQGLISEIQNNLFKSISLLLLTTTKGYLQQDVLVSLSNMILGGF